MESVDWNQKIKEALERTNIMALSTIGNDGSWTCPVHYTHGSKLELYFQSLKDTKHVANILNDPRVSVAIYHPDALPDGSHLGLQLKGTTKLVSEEKWLRFEITPDEAWYFNSKSSSPREKIDLAKLKL
jgi:general stress protein 26